MRKFAKVTLITAAIMISLGLFVGMIVTAFGDFSLIRNVTREGVATVSPGGFRFWDWSWGWPNSWSNRGWGWSWSENWSNLYLTVNGDRVSGRTYTAEFNEKIESLNISVGVGDFKVVPWDNDNFKISIDGYGACKYYMSGNTLYIEGYDMSMWRSVNISTENKLTLYVPESIEYNNIKIDVGVGALNINGLTVENLNTSSGVGSLNMRDMVVEKLNISNSVGETTFKGEVNGDISADCSVGNINLRIKGNRDDFNYALSCSLGNISIGNFSYTALDRESTINNNSTGPKMRLTCSIGNIDVNFY